MHKKIIIILRGATGAPSIDYLCKGPLSDVSDSNSSWYGAGRCQGKFRSFRTLQGLKRCCWIIPWQRKAKLWWQGEIHAPPLHINFHISLSLKMPGFGDGFGLGFIGSKKQYILWFNHFQILIYKRTLITLPRNHICPTLLKCLKPL